MYVCIMMHFIISYLGECTKFYANTDMFQTLEAFSTRNITKRSLIYI
jgi:hypothetical protein